MQKESASGCLVIEVLAHRNKFDAVGYELLFKNSRRDEACAREPRQRPYDHNVHIALALDAPQHFLEHRTFIALGGSSELNVFINYHATELFCLG